MDDKIVKKVHIAVVSEKNETYGRVLRSLVGDAGNQMVAWPVFSAAPVAGWRRGAVEPGARISTEGGESNGL